MSVASVLEALARCALTRSWAVGMCGQFCAAMYGYGASGYRDALTQWRQTPPGIRHPGATDAPPGALVFWGGGSAGHGHVAIADGTGSVFSIDIGGAGTVTRVSTGTITSRWGLPYLGWTAPYFQGQEWEAVAIYGMDVSMFQPINFLLTTPSDKKPVDFAIIKVTEGTGWVSSRWTGQRQWARDHGLSVGFYHFARPGNMVDQADRFLAQINLQPGDHLWFDWEDAGVTNAQKDAWISYVQGRAPGHRVGLYCNTSFWTGRDTTGFAGDGLWIATGGYPAGAPPIKSNWLLHQYSTAGNYDHNVAQFATRADMIAWAKGDEDVALTAAELKLLTETHDAVTKITSLVDTKVHGVGYYVAKGETNLAATLSQSRSNGGGISELKTALNLANAKLDTVAGVLAGLDLSQVPAEIAAKIEALKINVGFTEGS